MPTYEIIQNGGSVNRIVADEDFVQAVYPGAWKLLPDPEPQPEPEPDAAPAPVARMITRLAFRNRFTQAEKVAMELAALDDPAASEQQRQMAALLRANMKDIDAASCVDLDMEATRGGVQMLEAAGLLAPGRALEILDAPVQAHEVYRP
jgi:hypothetical protein